MNIQLDPETNVGRVFRLFDDLLRFVLLVIVLLGGVLLVASRFGNSMSCLLCRCRLGRTMLSRGVFSRGMFG